MLVALFRDDVTRTMAARLAREREMQRRFIDFSGRVP